MSNVAHSIRQLEFESLISDAIQNDAPLVRCLRAAGEAEIAEAIEESFAIDGTEEPLALLLLLHEGAESLELGVGSVPFLRHRNRLVPLLERPLPRPLLLEFTDRLPFPTGTGALAGCTLRLSGEAERLRVTLCGPPPSLADLDPNEDVRPVLDEVRSGLVVVSGSAGTRPELTAAAVIAHLAAERDVRLQIFDPPEEVEFMGTRSFLSCTPSAEAGSWARTFDLALREDTDVIGAGEFDHARFDDVLKAALSGHLVVLTAYCDTLEDLLLDLAWAGGPSEQRLLGYLLGDALSLLLVQRRDGPNRLHFEALPNSEELAQSLRDLHPPPVKRLLRIEQTRRRGWRGLEQSGSGEVEQ